MSRSPKKCLLDVCCALESKRKGGVGSGWGYSDASTMAEAAWHISVVHASAVRTIEELVDGEEFALLLKARNAIESGYSKFLTNLFFINYWINREAEKTGYIEGMDKKELRDLEARHRRELREEEQRVAAFFSPDEFPRIRKHWDEHPNPRPRIRRTFSMTDLPTKGRIQTLHRKMFPKERKYWKAHSNDLSIIWKDAGLESVPQSRPGEIPLPAERFESLKAFLSD
jgi:hypothetical protein